jgi:hypothetical protein
VVVKRGPTVGAEATGLAWLAVRDGPRLPTVLDLDERQLVTEYVPSG